MAAMSLIVQVSCGLIPAVAVVVVVVVVILLLLRQRAAGLMTRLPSWAAAAKSAKYPQFWENEHCTFQLFEIILAGSGNEVKYLTMAWMGGRASES